MNIVTTTIEFAMNSSGDPQPYLRLSSLGIRPGAVRRGTVASVEVLTEDGERVRVIGRVRGDKLMLAGDGIERIIREARGPTDA